MASTTWTVVRIGLWGNSTTTGKPRSHTRIDLSGDYTREQAIDRAKQIVAMQRDYFNKKQQILNCFDTGNFSVTVE